ncbi:class I SAM-dependent methyltransferase [Flavisphingomonas formosensis]|uniref:class I SAM-dependent methyltransferase n=1 Tax=Flavisphingomonas formosensis TaxID=861534 RepID=UPI0012FBEF65|nr:class I SAM-dependent methyltransferase [Sphingomonas formosensis]
MTTKDAADLGEMARVEGLLAALGPVEGKRIIDIGCGEGVIARGLAAAGASVHGYDPFIAPTEEISEGAGSYRLLQARADAIPEPDGSADAVLFVFSLHHVPRSSMGAALAEAKRLLKPGGSLCVAEPLAEGPAQYVMAPYHDETEVRANATQALAAHAAPAFGSETIFFFSEGRSYADFDDYAAQAIGNMRYNDYRETDIVNDEVRGRFEKMAAQYGTRFEQRVRVNLFA